LSESSESPETDNETAAGTNLPAEGSDVPHTSHVIPASDERIVEHQTVRVSQTSFTGPIPDPQSLKEYEQVFPGAISYIMETATKEQDHRHYSEKFKLETEAKIALRGQIFAVISLLLIIAGSIWLAVLGKTVEGIYLLLITMGILVLALMGSKFIPILPDIIKAWKGNHDDG